MTIHPTVLLMLVLAAWAAVCIGTALLLHVQGRRQPS